MPGGIGPFQGVGAPTLGVNEVQTLLFGGTGAGSTFKLSFNNATTAAINWSSTNATLVANILAALQALPTIGTGGVSVVNRDLASGLGHVDVTFLGNNATMDVAMMGVSAITGSLTVAVSETTKGVLATDRGASPGAFYIDTLNGDLYINDGSRFQPSWAMVGMRKAKVALAALDSAGGILAWKNTEPVKIFVIRLILDITTPATGACTAAFGRAANGTTSNNTLIDALDVHTAAGVFDNYVNHGASGLAMVTLAPGEYITGSKASGAAAGLVGNAHILFVRG